MNRSMTRTWYMYNSQSVYRLWAIFVGQPYIIILILCVCVCLSVCPTWDPEWEVVLPHSLHYLEELVWRVAQTAFWACTMCGLKEKAFVSYLPVRCRIPCTHQYTFGYLRQDESCQLQESCWNILKGYVLKDTPSTSQIQWLLLLFTWVGYRHSTWMDYRYFAKYE